MESNPKPNAFLLSACVSTNSISILNNTRTADTYVHVSFAEIPFSGQSQKTKAGPSNELQA